MMCRIKKRQKRFFESCKQLTEEDAILSKIMRMCSHLDFYKYYESLGDDLDQVNMNEMKEVINNSTKSHCTRYREISEVKYNDVIYGQYLREDKRVVLSKWRLSSHKLRIETGRYTTPLTPRQERVCPECPTYDEYNVVYQCPLYSNVRVRYRDTLLKLPTLFDFLNPTNIADASEVGDMLMEIEHIRSRLGLC